MAKTTDALMSDLRSWRPWRRLEAVGLLAEDPDPRALPLLVGVLADRDEGVREAAAAGLRARGRAASPYLLDALRDPDPRLRVGAALVLGDLREPRAVDPLLRLVGDGESGVGEAAIEALTRLGAAAPWR